jgi:hypothetical protein
VDRPAEGLIRLGLVDAGPERSEPVGPSAERPVRQRWAVAAVLAVLPGLLLGGAGAPATPSPSQVWSVPVSGEDALSPAVGFAADDHRLYLADADRLAAHRLADGRVEWQVSLPATDEEWVSVSLVAGLLAVTIFGATTLTIAYQPGSGQERWRHPGLLHEGSAGPLMTLMDPTAGPAGLTVTVVDPATGRAAGAVRLDAAEEHWTVWQAPDSGPQLLALARDGRLSRYDLATGEVAETVQTPHAEAPDSTMNSLNVVEGVLVVGDQTSDPPAAAGYHPATLTSHWTVPRVLWPSACARSVCVESPAGGGGASGVRAVDPMTGVTRWSIDCAGDDADTCSIDVQELADRLWVERVRWWEEGDREQVSSWIADPATGEPLTGTTSWRLRSGMEEADPLLYRDEAGQPPDQPSRLWWARSDVEPFRPVVLGAVAAESCEPHYPYLVCWTGGEAGLAVWRVGS